MRKIIRTGVALCSMLAAPAFAQDAPICDVVLSGMAKSRLTGSPTAMEYLREYTDVFSPRLRDSPIEQQNYDKLFRTPSATKTRLIDFYTSAGARHDGCFEIQGQLKVVLGNTALVRASDQKPVPVSVFAFTDASPNSFASAFEAGETLDKTNARIEVDGFWIDRKLSSDNPEFNRTNDAFANFSVMAFLKYTQRGKKVEGDYHWFAADLQRGDGPQLIAVACDGHCTDYLAGKQIDIGGGQVTLAAAQSGPVAPPDVQDDQLPTDPENLILSGTLEYPDGTVTMFGPFDFTSRVAQMPKGMQLTVRQALEELISNDETNRLMGRDILVDQNLLGPEFSEYILKGGHSGYHVAVAIPAPPPPTTLTALDLRLDQKYGSTILGACAPEAEISHPDHPTVTVKFQTDFNNDTGTDENGAETFGRLNAELRDVANAPILSEPLDTLSLRIFAPDTVTTFEGAPPVPTSCKLSWGNTFPSDAPLPMAELLSASGLAVTVTSGSVELSGVQLRSTARPVLTLAYSTTGPIDSNDQPTQPDVYPRWATESGGEDMEAALGLLFKAAQAHFSQSTKDLFLAEAAGGRLEKGFSPHIEFTKNATPELKPGEVGTLNLRDKMTDFANATGAVPRFVILGRTGLPVDTDYCAASAAFPEDTAKGSLLIDFVPGASVEYLPESVQGDLTDPKGDRQYQRVLRRLAARCPDTADGPIHWVLTPDLANQLTVISNLETLTKIIFGGVE